ncbi:MAG: fumarylacetoacetate hydrolase family protein [Acidithiobacillus sp.]
MRWSRYRQGGKDAIGIWLNGDLLRLDALDQPPSLDLLLTEGPSLAPGLYRRLRRLSGDALLNPQDVSFLPPVPGRKILCAGLNYHSHAVETALPSADFPNLFIRFSDTLVGHGQALQIPPVSTQLDYEGELAVVIGKATGPLAPKNVLDYVAGYTIFNDASVRDFQFRGSQWTLGKNFPATGGCGPVLVTADELPPGASGLSLQTEIDGVLLQDGNTADMIFDVATLISTVSIVMPLVAGDMIVTGTPAGVGFIRQPPRFLEPGEICTVRIEGLGALVNPVTRTPVAE